jgi:hypothetical protein
MGFQDADDEVGPFLEPPLRRLQHGVGLAHPRRRAEEDFEPGGGGGVLMRGA